jgi:hypothetical protein
MTPEEKRQRVREKIAEWIASDPEYPFVATAPITLQSADELIDKLDSLDVVIKDDEQENLIITNMVHIDEHYEVGDIIPDKDVIRTFRVKE